VADTNIEQILSGYRIAINGLSCLLSDEDLSPARSILARFEEIASESPDYASFSEMAVKEDLFTKISDELSKLSEKAKQAKIKKENEPITEEAMLSGLDINKALEPYRQLYEYTKKDIERKNTISAYEKLLSLGEKCETSAEFNYKAEKDKLFFEIGRSGVRDQTEQDFAKAKEVIAPEMERYHSDILKIISEVNSSCEMQWKIEKRLAENRAELDCVMFRLNMVMRFFNALSTYLYFVRDEHHRQLCENIYYQVLEYLDYKDYNAMLDDNRILIELIRGAAKEDTYRGEMRDGFYKLVLKI
jgi:hypothetical protein